MTVIRKRLFLILIGLFLPVLTLGVLAQDNGDQGGNDEDKTYNLMPAGLLFPVKIADPREPGLRVSYINPSGEAPHQGEAALGGHFGLFKARLHDLSALQVDVEAGVFSRFLFRSNQRLNNIDYKVGFPITFAVRNWSAKIQFYHVSSHLGDEETEVTGRKRIAFSREFLELLVGYRYRRFRFYCGPAYIVHAIPEAPGGILQLGADSRDLYSFSPDASLFLGVHADVRSEWNWEPDLSIRLGISLHPLQSKRSLDLGLTVYSGKTQRGQFFMEDEDYFALTLEFRP